MLAEDGIIIRGVYERSDAKVRLQEGMERIKGFIGEPFDTKGGNRGKRVRYLVDVKDGQKTGFFLDQKYNRLAVAKIAAGKHVLDCFTHTGAFALNAAKGGAASVTAVDVSQEAVDMTTTNIQRNGLADIVTAKQANVFDLLTEMAEQKNRDYDFIILDPPAFTKSGHTVHNAIRGYKEINLKAMSSCPAGGYFGHLLVLPLHARRPLPSDAPRCCQRRRRPPASNRRPPAVTGPSDSWNVPETNYLKFYLFQVV